MALTTSEIGSEISTEKLIIQGISDDPLVTSVILELSINSASIAVTLEHLPIFGTTDTFQFEVNSIIKDYFASEFLPLTGANQTTILNALAEADMYEVIGTVVQPTSYIRLLNVKNITQDVFEIEDFSEADYDCGSTGSTTSKLLTSSPSILKTGDLTSLHVSCLKSSYTGVTPLQEWTIDEYLNGAFVGQTTEAVNVPVRDYLSQPGNTGNYDIATYRFDFDSSQGYNEVRIYIRDIANPFTMRSETKTFKLNDACERAITLSWLNEYGAQDTFTFLGNITRTGKYTDSTFKRTRPVTPLSTDVGDLVYKSSYNYEYDIYSDRMPENNVKWLSNILINKRAAIQTEKVNAIPGGALTLTNDEYFGLMPIASAYGDLVDAGNGFAYGSPRRSGEFIKFEIATNIITTIATAIPSGGNIQYDHGILSPTNGKIYYMNSYPDTADILVFDPVGETHYTFGILTDTVGRPSITPAGIIYANGASVFGKMFKINTNTDVITELIVVGAGGGGTSIYSSTGFVYVFPGTGVGEYYKINTSTDAVSTVIDANYAEQAHSQASITSLGVIYLPSFFPTVNDVFVLDTATDLSLVLNTGSSLQVGYQFSFLMSDDNVYLIGNETDILKIDTSTNLITVAGSYVPELFGKMTVIGDAVYSVSGDLNGSVLKLTFESASPAIESKYFPITITTDETTLDDKFTPETIFRLKFRMANKRKGLK